jgi:ubiquitin thioesterase OTU1
MIPIRLRAPTGQSRLDVDQDSTLGHLVELIKKQTGLQNFSLKYSYPLKNLDIDASAQATLIRDLSLRGETLVVVPVDLAPAQPSPVAEPKPTSFVAKGIEPDETVLEWPARGGYMGK